MFAVNVCNTFYRRTSDCCYLMYEDAMFGRLTHSKHYEIRVSQGTGSCVYVLFPYSKCLDIL